MKVNHEEN